MPENREKAKSQWSTLKSGPLAKSETVKRAENWGEAKSQWTTLKSDPLAQSETEKKAETPLKKKRPAMPVTFDLFCRWPGLDDWFRLVFDEGVICDIRHDWYHIVLIFLVIWWEDIVDDLAR